jgi:perosamine synthetase
MITTKHEEIYERAKYLRDHAMSQEKRYWHTEVGFNYRMTNIQAALGLAQLERIEELIGKKREIYGWYEGFLRDVEGIRLNPERSWVRNIFWMVCLVLEGNTGISRNELMDKLKAKGIDTRPFFHPISQLPMYRGGPVNPIAYGISEKGLNLPSGVNLEKKDVRWITSQIKGILRAG